MRKRVSFGLVAFSALVIAASAYAASAHFIRCSASRQGDTLVVSFKEAGLGNNQLVTIKASANATATYVCRNKGGKVPSDPKKTTVSGLVSVTGTFSSGKNGTVSGTLTLTAPPPPADFTCPPGQRVELLAGSVTFANALVQDVTNNVSCTP